LPLTTIRIKAGLIADLETKLALLRGLINGEDAHTGPAYLILDLTRRCNNICLGCFSHCMQPRDPSPGDQTIEDIPLDLAQRIGEELAQLSTSEVVLLGDGEPLLHDRYFDIVTLMKKAGLKVQTFTNAILIDEQVSQALVETAQDVLNVTFWAVNAKEHERWHPGVNPDFLERRRRGVDRVIVKRRLTNQQLPKVNIQLPLNRYNFTNIEERVHLVLESGCDTVTFGFFRDWGGQYQDQCLLPEDEPSMRDTLLWAKRHFESAGIDHNIDEYLARLKYGGDAWLHVPCYAGWYTSYIKVDGSVLACGHCSLVMGNLHSNSFAEIWNAAKYREFRRRTADLSGLLSLKGQCDCSNCCLWRDNRRVHRIFRWFRPLVQARAKLNL
jgi:MoaA/NifB/PqqE/SkfB family radical SAM enzyme